MTRAIYDLQQYVNSNYVHTNVAGATVENHTADPTIAVESIFERTPPANNANGKIVFVSEKEGASIELGEFRHKVYFVEGYIQRQNTTIFDDATIMAMKSELQRTLNVNNNSVSRTYKYILFDSEYDGNIIDPIISFTINVTETDVSAIS